MKWILPVLIVLARMQAERAERDKVDRMAMKITSERWHKTMAEYDAQPDSHLTEQQLRDKNAILMDWRISQQMKRTREEAERRVKAGETVD